MLRDIINTSLTRNVAFAFKLVLGIIVARLFGTEGKGMIVAFFLIPEFIAIIGGIGVEEGYLYTLAKKKIKSSTYKKILLIIITIQIPVIIIIEVIYFYIVDYDYSTTEYLLCITLAPIYLILEVGRFSIRGINDIKSFNKSILIEALVPVLFLSILIFQKELWWFIVGQSTGLLVALIYVWLKFYSSYDSTLVNENTKCSVKEIYNYGVKVYVFRVINVLDSKIAALIISIALTLSELGIYSVALSISLLLQMGLQVPVSTVILPKLVTMSEKTRVTVVGIVTRSVFFVSIFFLIFTITIGHWLITSIFGNAFSDAYLPMIILIFGRVLKTPLATLNCYFKARGEPEKVTGITLRAAPISIILSITLIPIYGVTGAAVASVIANIVFGYYMISLYRKATNATLQEIVAFNKNDYVLAQQKLIKIKNKYL
ncbi:MAG: oligosaccharide flippase family protein [Candidatus Thiodiazotropha sp. DIVDIV]